jgi:FkbM family methyltransferase
MLRRVIRPYYRRVRTQYLRMRYPRGGFISTTGVPVFCDFHDPAYTWYDADSDYVRFHARVLQGLVRQSRGDAFVDVGAHFGFYTALLAHVLTGDGRKGVIVAVEPDRHHLECLRQTAARCASPDVQIDVVAAALGDRDGTTSLYRAAGSCLHSYSEPTAVPCYDVPMYTLDSLLARRAPGSRVALIKLDVDGAEAGIMDGWTRTIRDHQPLVLTEFSPEVLRAAGRDPRTVFEELCARFRVTDFVLSHTEVAWPSLSSAELQ